MDSKNGSACDRNTRSSRISFFTIPKPKRWNNRYFLESAPSWPIETIPVECGITNGHIINEEAPSEVGLADNPLDKSTGTPNVGQVTVTLTYTGLDENMRVPIGNATWANDTKHFAYTTKTHFQEWLMTRSAVWINFFKLNIWYRP